MKKEKKINPEDLLIEDKISKERFTRLLDQGEDIDNNEIQIAQRIYSFLSSSPGSFPIAEKNRTKNQIRVSVRKLKLVQQIKRWSVAAAVLIICCVAGVWYFQLNPKPEIIDFAQTVIESKPGSDTRLVLHDGQEVRISKEHSQIIYTQNGENITIGADQKVDQKIPDQKTAFNTVIVPYGKRTQISLSDGTKVWLNSGSKLIYPAVFTENKREVYIDGEAVFEVSPSEKKPFQVITHDFNIKVLGTVFNVSAYTDDQYSSAVLEKGKVELHYRGASRLSNGKLVISPGTRAVFDPEQKSFQQQRVNPANFMSWREGFLIFESEKLSVILKKMGRYYNVEVLIQSEQLGNETFSGNLDLKNTPEEVLKVIAETTPFIYSYENENLVITPK